MNIDKIKHNIKAKPILLLVKPWYLFFIPIIIFRILFNRFKLTEERVFIVESTCDDLLGKNIHLIEIAEKFYLSEINTLDEFLPYFRLRVSESDDVNALIYEEKVNYFFKNNSSVFILFNKEDLNKNKPLGYIFTQIKETLVPLVEYEMKLTKDTFSLFDTYVFIDSRGKKYHELLYYMITERFKQNGYSNYCGFFIENNQRSIKAHVKMGMSQITKIVTRRNRFFASKIIVENKSFDMAELIRKTESA